MIQESEPLRKLTTEEIYQDLYKQYKKSCIEIGKLNAEIHELTFLKEKLENELSELKKPDKKLAGIIRRETAYIQDLLVKIKRLEDQNVRLRQGNGELISKLIQYEKQYQQPATKTT